MRYLIDTDIASYYLRGKFNLLSAFQEKGFDQCRVSIITIAELKVLAYKNPNSKINLGAIESLARELGVIAVSPDGWDQYSRIKAETLTIGRPRGDMDILQAALAREKGLIIVTNNTSHFLGIAEVENWKIEWAEK